ncbi:MAG: hypothetical protein ABI378_03130 [Chitinophagaceae bacterium]
MKAIKLIVVFVLNLICSRLGAQSNYSKYISTNSVGRTHYSKGKYGDSRIIYLGAIKTLADDTVFYIFTEFARLQAANVTHGHSMIYYYGKNRREKKRFDVNMPYELPYKLKNNVLYFKYTETKQTKIFKNNVGTTIPKELCVEPGNCF